MPKQRIEILRFDIKVAASSLSISGFAPGVLTMSPDGEAGATILIEGDLDRSPYRTLTRALVQVGSRCTQPYDPGGAVANPTHWTLVLSLPFAEFSTLTSMVLTDKLSEVSVAVEMLKRGAARIRSISFGTRSVPLYAES